MIGGLLRASGVDDLVTVDVHSSRATRLMGIPVRSLAGAGRERIWVTDSALAPCRPRESVVAALAALLAPSLLGVVISPRGVPIRDTRPV